MTAKRVVLTAQARREVRETTAWYRQEGGAPLARRWAAAVEGVLRRTGENPRIGSNRYAVSLNVPGLRFRKVGNFPYLVFYVECEEHIDVSRVLHAQRDIPAWMQEPE